jgi:hypothetical protein
MVRYQVGPQPANYLIIQAGLTPAGGLGSFHIARAASQGGRQPSEAGEIPALSRNGEALG